MSDTLSLPPRPNLERYKKLAKDLQCACKSADPGAIRQWSKRLQETIARLQGVELTRRVRNEIHREAQRLAQRWREFRKSNEHAGRCTLSSAQFFIARAHGFASWSKFAGHVKQLARENGPVSSFEAVHAIVSGEAARQAVDERIEVGGVTLGVETVLPEQAHGVVLFGVNEGRRHPRNRFVANVLNRGRIATLTADLQTEDEEIADIGRDEFRFDLPLLSARIAAVTDWIRRQPIFEGLGLGYLGTDTVAAAALRAAADRRNQVKAMVSLGGRPDLTGHWLGVVQAPTLFIAGSKNTVLLGFTRSALMVLPRETECDLEVIHGASHELQEEGALSKATELARDWFGRHLTS